MLKFIKVDSASPVVFQRMLLQFRQTALVERVVEEGEGCECIFSLVCAIYG